MLGYQSEPSLALPAPVSLIDSHPQPDFTVGTDPAVLGTLGVSLGNTNTAGYIYFPEDYEAPLHGPGANQWVFEPFAEIYPARC